MSEFTQSPPPKGRSGARYKAVQALYQWQLDRVPLWQIENQFFEENDMGQANKNYFKELLSGVTERTNDLDQALDPYLDRAAARLDPITRAVLWVGAYELLYCSAVPWRVAINEAVEMAKTFGAEDSHKYVNGVLDKLARRQTSSENPSNHFNPE